MLSRCKREWGKAESEILSYMEWGTLPHINQRRLFSGWGFTKRDKRRDSGSAGKTDALWRHG